MNFHLRDDLRMTFIVCKNEITQEGALIVTSFALYDPYIENTAQEQ